jgi:hypothetical protein
MYANVITKIGATAINRSRSPAENRYIEGPFSEVVKDLRTDATGALSVGPDGVLRSFAGNLEVIDYRQLDPEQVPLTDDLSQMKQFFYTPARSRELERSLLPLRV